MNEGVGHEAQRTARARAAAARALERAARSARTFSGRAEKRAGPGQHVAPLARRAAGALKVAATYTRSHELGEMRDDLERAIRRHPARALAIAFVAGYLTRRLL